MNYAFNPYVRYIAKSKYFIADKYVIGSDCRFLYILQGEGTFQTQTNCYRLVPGALVYYPCGTPYKITSQNQILFYTVNFDFTQEHTQILPMEPEVFRGYLPTQMLYSQQVTECKAFLDVLFFENARWAENGFRQIYEEMLLREEGSATLQNICLKAILIHIYRRIIQETEGSLCRQVDGLLQGNMNLSNLRIAEQLNYHPYYLSAKFKKETGLTLHQYVLRQKLSSANRLITSSQMSLDEIASACGFSSQAHLSAMYKRFYGISPSKLRLLA